MTKFTIFKQIIRYNLYIKTLNELLAKKQPNSLKLNDDQLTSNNQAHPKAPLTSSLPTLLVKGDTVMNLQKSNKRESRLVKSSHNIDINSCESDRNISPLVLSQNYNNNNVKRFSSRRLGTSRRSYMCAVNISK